MISPPRLISKNNLNAYKDLHIRDAQLLFLLMDANAEERKFARHFFETFLPKDLA